MTPTYGDGDADVAEFIRDARVKHGQAIERAVLRMEARLDEIGVLAHFAISANGEVSSGVELSHHVQDGVVEHHDFARFGCPICRDRGE